MLKDKYNICSLLFIVFFALPGPASPQYLTRLVISPADQVVFCDSVTSSFEEMVFSRLVEQHGALFFSTYQSGMPVLMGRRGEFFESKSAIFVMNEISAIEGGCFPINDLEAGRLRSEVNFQLNMEKDLIPTAPNLKRAAENNWCQPVFEIPISKSKVVIVYRADVSKHHDIDVCASHFNDFIILEE